MDWYHIVDGLICLGCLGALWIFAFAGAGIYYMIKILWNKHMEVQKNDTKADRQDR